MNNNLYKEFNCNTKEELYEKIKRLDEDVKPLLEFLDYTRSNMINNKKAIDSPEVFINYVKSITLPTKDNSTIIFVNTKNHPIHLKRIRLSQKGSMKEAIREGLIAGANRVFMAFSGETSDEIIKKTKEYFEKAGMKITDTMNYDKENDGFLSNKAGRTYYTSASYDIANDPETAYGEKDYSLKNKYVDFTSYLASNELQDLHIVDDVDEVRGLLKIGYQHHQQEVFGMLIYDSNEKIIGVEELFTGGTDATIVDLTIVARTLFGYQNIKGFAAFHNHPSGIPTASREDIVTTMKIKNMAEIFDVEFLDHYIVGKERTLSFAQEVNGFMSKNIGYQDKMGRLSMGQGEKGVNKKESMIKKLREFKGEAEKNSGGKKNNSVHIGDRFERI